MKIRDVACSLLIAILLHSPAAFSQPSESSGLDDSMSENAYVEVRASVASISTAGTTTIAASGTLVSDEFTGIVRYSFPFALPPLRGYDPPSPILSYSSRTNATLAGRGWSLDFGSISAQLNFNGSQDYWHDSASGQAKIVEVAQDQFAPAVQPPFSRYFRVGDHWEMVDADGSRFLFGLTETTRISGQGGDTRIRRWMLDRIVDPNGNFVELTYERDGPIAYLAEVRYGGHEQDNGVVDIAPYVQYAISYETRPDTSRKVLQGLSFAYARRVSSLELYFEGSLQRRYELAYTRSPVTGSSLLGSITETSASGLSRPATTFNYKSDPIEFGDPELMVPASSRFDDRLRWTGSSASQSQLVDFSGGASPRFCAPEAQRIICHNLDGQYGSVSIAYPLTELVPDWGNTDASLIRVVDLQSDGLPDLCLIQEPGITCWVNVDGRFDRAIGGPAWSLSDPITVGSTRFGDINADKFMDLCRLGGEELECVLGSSTGFLLDPASVVKGPKWQRRVDRSGLQDDLYWSQPEAYRTIALVDLNGDRAADVCARGKQGIECFLVGVGGAFDLLNRIQGPDWRDADAFEWVGRPRSPWQHEEHYETIAYPDINGDGIPDICGRDKEGILCHFGTGSGFEEQEVKGPNWFGVSYGPSIRNKTGWAKFQRWKSIAFVDITNDGLDDVCGRTETGYQCFTGTIDGFGGELLGPSLPDTYEGNWTTTEFDSTIRFGDANSDGALDLCARTGKGFRCWLSKGDAADLLIEIRDSAGGSTAITYAPYIDPQSRVPFPLLNVSETVRDDGHGGKVRRTFEYVGGFFSPRWDDFRGYRTVTVREYEGSTELERIFTTTYSQGDAVELSNPDDRGVALAAAKGRVLESVTIDPTGVDSEATEYRYAISSLGVLSTVTQVQQTASRCRQTECKVLSSTRYVVDPATGNMLEQLQENLLATSDDDVTITYEYGTYATGTTSSRVTEIITYRGIGTRQYVRSVRYGYDESHDCSATFAVNGLAPQATNLTAGNLTSQWESGDGVESHSTLSGYDDYGNIVCARSSTSGLVTTEFDAETKTFALRSTNALGHTSQSAFFGIDGRADEGLFGLLAETVSAAKQTIAYTYDPLGRVTEARVGTNRATRFAYLFDGDASRQGVQTTSPTGIVERTYIDGWGRAWRNEKHSQNGGVTWSESVLNSSGKPVSTTMLVGDSETVTTAFEYDFLGRVTSEMGTGRPLTVYCYGINSKVTLASDGTRVDEIFDDLGRKVQIAEFTGKAPPDCRTTPAFRPSSTTFEYDSLFGLTGIIGANRTLKLLHDSYGRRTALVDSAFEGQWTYGFSERGLLAIASEPGGRRVAYEYDLLGRPTLKTIYAPGNSAFPVEYRYDSQLSATGQITSVITPDSTTTRLYDLDGRVVSVMETIQGRTYVTSTIYDQDGRVTDRFLADGYHLSYDYVFGYLVSVSDAGGELVGFDEFDGIGRPKSVTYRSGVQTTYLYSGEDADWCPEFSLELCGMDIVDASGRSLWSARRETNDAGLVTQLLDSNVGIAEYGYDERDRLALERRSEVDVAYDYDDLDNILASSIPATYVTGTVRQASIFGRPIRYDNRGRITSYGEHAGNVVELRYGSYGSVSSYVAGATTVRLVYGDHGELISFDGNAPPTDIVGGSSACRQNVCEHTLFAGALPLMTISKRGAEIAYMHSDFYGSVNLVTSGDGLPIMRRSFSAFGQPVYEWASPNYKPSLLGQGFLSSINLPGSDLVLLGSRFYDPKIGRFLQPDDTNPGLSLLRRANPYSYGYNNPVRFSDPDGRIPVIAIVAIVGAVVGALDAAFHEENILEGAVRGAVIAAAGYSVGYVAASAGSAMGANAYMSAAVGQGLFSGALAASRGQEFGPAFGRGALMGLVSAGIGRGVMEVVPVPATETFAGALGRQFLRDGIRGAASSIVVGAVYGDSNLGDRALQGAFYAVAYNSAQTFATLAYASAVSNGPPRWIGHSLVFNTPASNMPAGTAAMQLGFASLVDSDVYGKLGDACICMVGDPAVEEAWETLEHEQSHTWQYNALGANFLPAYLSAWFFGKSGWSDLAPGGDAYRNSPYENGSFGRPGAPGIQDLH